MHSPFPPRKSPSWVVLSVSIKTTCLALIKHCSSRCHQTCVYVRSHILSPVQPHLIVHTHRILPPVHPRRIPALRGTHESPRSLVPASPPAQHRLLYFSFLYPFCSLVLSPHLSPFQPAFQRSVFPLPHFVGSRLSPACDSWHACRACMSI